MLIGNLDRLLGGSRETVLVECRRCGRTCDDEPERCPACSGSEFARYELE